MGTSARDYYIHNVAVNYTRTISTTWLNELLVGVNRSAVHYGTSADSTNWPSTLGMPNPFNATGWPTMYTCEAPDCTAFFGWDSDNVHNQNLTSETIDDNATWTHGKHIIQFGFGGDENRTTCVRTSKPKAVTNGPSVHHNWDASSFGPRPDTGSGLRTPARLPDFLSNQYNVDTSTSPDAVRAVCQRPPQVTPKLTLNLAFAGTIGHLTKKLETACSALQPRNPGTFQVISLGNVSVDQISGILPPCSRRGQMWADLGHGQLRWIPFKPLSSIRHDFGPAWASLIRLTAKP